MFLITKTLSATMPPGLPRAPVLAFALVFALRAHAELSPNLEMVKVFN